MPALLSFSTVNLSDVEQPVLCKSSWVVFFFFFLFFFVSRRSEICYVNAAKMSSVRSVCLALGKAVCLLHTGVICPHTTCLLHIIFLELRTDILDPNRFKRPVRSIESQPWSQDYHQQYLHVTKYLPSYEYSK